MNVFMSKSRPQLRAWITHCAAFMLGIAIIITLQSYAADSAPETMLSKLKSGDFEGLRSYLQIKAGDASADQAKASADQAKLVKQLTAIEDDLTSAIQRQSASDKHMSQIDKHLSQIDQQLAKLAQNSPEHEEPAAAPKTGSNTVTAPFTVVDNAGKPIFEITYPGAPHMVSAGDNSKDAKDKKVGGPWIRLIADAQSGGRIQVMGPGGAHSGVDIAIRKEGGSVQVSQTSGGTPLAELSASDKYGALTTYAKSGVATVLLRSTADSGVGNLTLSTADGSTAVEAGVTTKGFGVVKVGPAGNGPAGTLGNGFKVASEIAGKN